MMNARMRTEPSTRQRGHGVDFIAVVDQVLALLHQRARQDGCTGLATSSPLTGAAHPASRVTPDADADRGGSQEGTGDHDRDEVERGVVWIAS
jgi:hypothetical protein